MSTSTLGYNPFIVYCRELAPGTVSLTRGRAQGDDSKHDLHYTRLFDFSLTVKVAPHECVFRTGQP